MRRVVVVAPARAIDGHLRCVPRSAIRTPLPAPAAFVAPAAATRGAELAAISACSTLPAARAATPTSGAVLAAISTCSTLPAAR